MNGNNFLSEFSHAMKTLSTDLNLPHLTLNEDYCCKLKYDNDFDLEIMGIPEGGIQLHAFLAQTTHFESNNLLFRKLLEMNNMTAGLGGCYFGLSEPLSAISFNHVVHLESITATELMTLIHHFISKSQLMKQELQEIKLKSDEAHLIERPKPHLNNENIDHLNMLAYRA